GVHRPRRRPPVAGLRRAEERRARPGHRGLGAVARRRRGRLTGAAVRDRRGPRLRWSRRRLRRAPAQHLLGALGPPRRALSRLAGPPLPPRPRTVRAARGPRVGERGWRLRAVGRSSMTWLILGS